MQTDDDADIDAVIDEMNRLDRLESSAASSREAELEIAKLRRRIEQQDEVINDLLKRQQQQSHGDPSARRDGDTPSAAPAQVVPQIDPAAVEWAAANPWFHTDEELHAAAIALEGSMVRRIPNVAARLAKVKAELMKTFPHKFGNQARQAPPAVSRPGPQGGRPRPTKEPTLADLDDAERSALAAFKRVDPKFSDAIYLKIYKTPFRSVDGRQTWQ